MEWQLRIYEIAPGKLDVWIDEWRAQVAPLRERLGFRVLGPWVDGDTFIWMLGYDGGDGFAAADARYYESAERRALDPDPARHIRAIEHRTIREVDR